MPVLPFDCNDVHFRASSQEILGSITPPHIFSRSLSIVKKMQPRSLHHVHSGQVVWSRRHLRPTASLGQSSRLAQPQQQVPVARPKMTSKLIAGTRAEVCLPFIVSTPSDPQDSPVHRKVPATLFSPRDTGGAGMLFTSQAPPAPGSV